MDACTAGRAGSRPSFRDRSRRARPRTRTRSACGSSDGGARTRGRARAGRSRSWPSLAARGRGELDAREEELGRREAEHRDRERGRVEGRDKERRPDGSPTRQERDQGHDHEPDEARGPGPHEQRDPERDLAPTDRREHVFLVPAERARAAQDLELTAVGVEELRDEPLVDPDEGEREPVRTTRHAGRHQELRSAAALQDETQSIEAPGRGPADQRPEHEPIEESPGRPEARRVVVAREEHRALPGWYVLPVARALADQRLAILGPEAQGRRALAVLRERARALTSTLDREAEAEARRVAEELRRVRPSPGQVLDPAEAQVPGLVDCRIL